MTEHEKTTTYCTQLRARALPAAARWVFNEVLAAMQNAEELGGPQGPAYLDLMQAVIDEATHRQQVYRQILAEQPDL
ncbi:MAG: hypothetical protein BroJett003_01490 [Planctomycetota bacterium]|nr:MAG: hypothetical protein BroJett003_01490 [Planctomycetota bacterium]